MININEVIETNNMIEKEKLDVRTVTLGISLLDCVSDNVDTLCANIYRRVTSTAEKLVKTAREIEREYAIPIVNKRISVTPIALIGASACKSPEDYVKIGKTLDDAAHKVGVNFLGGFSALPAKGMTRSEELLIKAIPEVLSETESVCASVNLGATKTGINMDAVRLMGHIIKETAKKTASRDGIGCAKLVVLCNAPDDNPFMAGAFHGVTETDNVINVGVSGPGVINHAIQSVRGRPFGELCDTIKKTAF